MSNKLANIIKFFYANDVISVDEYNELAHCVNYNTMSAEIYDKYKEKFQEYSVKNIKFNKYYHDYCIEFTTAFFPAKLKKETKKDLKNSIDKQAEKVKEQTYIQHQSKKIVGVSSIRFAEFVDKTKHSFTKLKIGFKTWKNELKPISHEKRPSPVFIIGIVVIFIVILMGTLKMLPLPQFVGDDIPNYKVVNEIIAARRDIYFYSIVALEFITFHLILCASTRNKRLFYNLSLAISFAILLVIIGALTTYKIEGSPLCLAIFIIMVFVVVILGIIMHLFCKGKNIFVCGLTCDFVSLLGIILFIDYQYNFVEDANRTFIYALLIINLLHIGLIIAEHIDRDLKENDNKKSEETDVEKPEEIEEK